MRSSCKLILFSSLRFHWKMPLNPFPLRKENRELLADSRPPSLLADDAEDVTGAEDEDDASPLLF